MRCDVQHANERVWKNRMTRFAGCGVAICKNKCRGTYRALSRRASGFL